MSGEYVILGQLTASFRNRTRRWVMPAGALIAFQAVAEPVPGAALPEVVISSSSDDAIEAGDSSQDRTKAGHHTLFNPHDLAVAHERSIDEVLRGEQGIGVTKGGSSGIGLLQVRGVAGQGTVRLDGMPVPDTLPGTLNLNALLPEAQDSILISRGFGPASRAFSALGGSIDLTSRNATETGADLRVEGGTFGFLKETLRGSLAGQKARIAVTVNRTDAFDGAYHAQKSNNNPERDPFNANHIQAKAGIDLSDRLAWEGSLLYRDARNGWDGYGFRRGVFTMVDEKDSYLAEETWIAQNTLKAYLNDDWTSRLQLGYTHNQNRAWVIGIRSGYTADLYKARWENDQRLWRGPGRDALHLVWGAEGRHEWAEARTYGPLPTLTPGPDFAESRNEQAGFVDARFAFGRLSGDAGVRYESYDRFDSHALVHAAVAWQVLDAVKLHANGGNGFRIPSYAERLFPLIGNPSLRPERGAGGDLGLEWQALSRLKLNMTGFYSRYDDLLVISWSPLPSAQIPCMGLCTGNVPNATIAGIETGAELTWNPQWRGGAAYTYNDTRNLDNGRRLPYQPTSIVRVWGEWRAVALPVTLWAEGIYRSLAQNDIGNQLDVDDSFRLNLHADYRINARLDLYVRGENLTNNQTPDAFGFDHPGAAVYGGIAWKL